VSSFLASVSSDIASATAVLPTPAGTSTNGSGLIRDLDSLFSIIAGAIIRGVGQELETVINEVVKQWYSLYMTKYCEGDYTPSYTSPNAKANTTSCTKLSELTPVQE
jgi:phosphoglucomutase